MPKTIRFHLDEGMPKAVAKGLRKRDRDCTTSKDAGLISAPDTDQLAFATMDGRVLITRDTDFIDIATNNTEHAGIVYWTQKVAFGQLVKDLDEWVGITDADEFRGQLRYF